MDAYVNVNRLFMHIRMEVHSIRKVILGICTILYYFPLYNICKRSIHVLGKEFTGLVNESYFPFVSCRTVNIDPFYETEPLLFMELCLSGKKSMRTF